MRVLLVGDTHGNTEWLERAVVPAAIRGDADVILQLGDFGWWPGSPTGPDFINAARRSPIPLWWIDGNHEHHNELARTIADLGDNAGNNAGDDTGAIHLGGNLTYLPRGTRVEFDGVAGVVCGGAHSIDRQRRDPGTSWFESERVTDADVARCISGGAADVLFSHDAPAGWEIPGLIPDDALASGLKAELPSCWSHRDLVAQVASGVTPSLVVHGHYHSAYMKDIDAAWGPLRVVGLDCDNTTGNLALLECVGGNWSVSSVDLPT